ncbi:MAG: hypothetical protein ACRDTF_23020 [Pseudonocardiaceae bacterium]
MHDRDERPSLPRCHNDLELACKIAVLGVSIDVVVRSQDDDGWLVVIGDQVSPCPG